MDNKDFFILIFSGTQVLVTIAGVFVAMILGYVTCQQNKLKRQNDLFDKRYDFYRKIETIWIKTRNENSPPLDDQTLIPLATEGGYLYGKDIRDHILSLEGKAHVGSPFFANDDFSHPFEKYLNVQ